MKPKLDKEEKEIVETYKQGEWKSTPHFEERKEELSEYARNTLKKNKRLNIRISEKDLRELQRRAIHEGIPYQTYISSILHKFVNGYFVERSTQMEFVAKENKLSYRNRDEKKKP